MNKERELLQKIYRQYKLGNLEPKHRVCGRIFGEIEAELAKPEAEPEEIAVAMKAIRHAWEGNKKASADYIELMASRLEKSGKSDSAMYVRNFLAELKGEKDPVFIVPMNSKQDDLKPEAEPVGFIDQSDDGIFGDVDADIANGLCRVGDLLYTSPRPMQRLANEDIKSIAEKTCCLLTYSSRFANAIMDAMIEKNK